MDPELLFVLFWNAPHCTALPCSSGGSLGFCGADAVPLLPGLVLQAHANRYKRHIVPVLSVSVDFYIRVFVRIYT